MLEPGNARELLLSLQDSVNGRLSVAHEILKRLQIMRTATLSLVLRDGDKVLVGQAPHEFPVPGRVASQAIRPGVPKLILRNCFLLDLVLLNCTGDLALTAATFGGGLGEAHMRQSWLTNDGNT